jgi:hypothetical protein
VDAAGQRASDLVAEDISLERGLPSCIGRGDSPNVAQNVAFDVLREPARGCDADPTVPFVVGGADPIVAEAFAAALVAVRRRPVTEYVNESFDPSG